MAAIWCDGASVYVAVLVLCGAAAAVAVLRAALCAVGVLLRSLTSNGERLPAVLEQVLCTTVLVASLVLSGDASGLLPWLLLLAALLSAVFCWSFVSFRWIAVTGFLLGSVSLTHVVGPMLVEKLESGDGREEWSALVRGQRVLIPAPSAPREPDAASSATCTPPLVASISRPPHIYSYYDKVRIEGMAEFAAVSAVAPPPALIPAAWRLLLHPMVLPPVQAAVLSRGAATPSVSRDTRARPASREGNTSASVVYLVATGDDTHVSHYTRHLPNTTAPVGTPVRDSVHLVGRRPVLRNSDVYCLLARPSSNAGDGRETGAPPQPRGRWRALLEESACMQLHRSGTLRNITVRWAYEAVPSIKADADATDEANNSTRNASATRAFAAAAASEPWRVLRVAAPADLSCADALAGLRREVGEAVADALLVCVDDLDVLTLPQAFVAKAPLLVWFGWQFPTYVHLVQDALAFWFTYALMPAWSYAAKAFYLAGQATVMLGQHVGAWLVGMAPYAKRGAEQVAIFAGGAVCGTVAPDKVPPLSPSAGAGVPADVRARPRLPAAALMRPWGWSTMLSQRCQAFARPHAAHPAFRAGVSTRVSAVAVVSGAADALDLVPGVWSVYAWAWRAEYRVTVHILTAVQEVAHIVLCVAPRPAVGALLVALRWVAATAPVLGVQLKHLWRLVLRLRVLAALAHVGHALWALEKRVWAGEVAALTYILRLVGSQCAAVLSNGAACAMTVGEWVAVLLRRYNNTSFSIHAAVVLLQTMLLLVAMRNEMNEYVAAELRLQKQQRQEQRTSLGTLVYGGGGAGGGGSLLTRYLPTGPMSRLPLSAFASRVSGFWMLVRAHHVACGRYVFLHAVAVFVLVGLSVLPFASKLHALALRYVLPWMSSQCFLAFFTPEPPPARHIAILVVLRIAGTTLLQNTVGDFIYHVLKDLLIAVGLTGGLALLLWAWPQRKELAKQVATAITDSLHVTPAPTPRREHRGGSGSRAGRAGGVSTPSSSTWRAAGLPLAPQRRSLPSSAALDGDHDAAPPPLPPVLPRGDEGDAEGRGEEAREGADSGSPTSECSSPSALQQEEGVEMEQQAPSQSRSGSVSKQIDLSDAL